LDDVERLVRLGDTEGIKIRVMQMYREREDAQRICQDSVEKVIPCMREAIEARERAIAEINMVAMSVQNECREQIILVK
jgi:hypothetical protein